MREFNTTAACLPSKHYMVDLTERVIEIRRLIEAGKYFTINRARQYGKTTTLAALQRSLQSDYIVLSLSLEGIGEAGYRTEEEFVQSFSRLVLDQGEFFGVPIPDSISDALNKYCSPMAGNPKMDELYRTFRRWAAQSALPLVMFIDEVDGVANNQVFLSFLRLLRDGYIARETRGVPTLRSVVLAGVTDVKHLKGRKRREAAHEQNSPWNIAADFTVDMSLSEEGIKGMLREYEEDHGTGMDTAEIARLVHNHTSGYPFLVSRICQLLDTRVTSALGASQAWTAAGMSEALKLLLAENNTLFQSVTKSLDTFPRLKASIRSILMEGTRLTWNAQQDAIVQMEMYGLIKNENNTVRVSNRVFETMLYNLFLSDEELQNNVFSREGDLARNMFVRDGKLNMRLVLERFIDTYIQVFGPLKERFKEKDGREQFLLYLKPIINGTGNYYIESQTRDQTRTDVVVDYLGQRYVVELKIWRGPRYNADGERQVSEYLDHFGLSRGYMLSFNFNKKKEVGVKRVHVGDKVLFEATL